MKYAVIVFLGIVLVGLICMTSAEAFTHKTRPHSTVSPVKNTPQFRAHLACFNGEIDSRSSCSGGISEPNINVTNGSMTCGYAGHVSEIEWVFIERRDGNDVYAFARKYPLNESNQTTTTKIFEFSGSRVVIFQDAFQAIVIDSPKK